ncbi:MAG: hypothetical protein HQK53_14620 [Oligoflexia bacterium]|nr:hypothetical protein [Oligoflexia bacterium]
MNKWRDGSYIPADCKNCKALEWCNAACRCQSECFYQQEMHTDPWMTETFLTTPSVFCRVNTVVHKRQKDVLVDMSDDIRWRKENDQDDQFLLFNKQKSEATKINGTLMNFISDLKTKLKTPSSVAHIAFLYNTDIEDESFINIIEKMIDIGVLVVV